MPPTWTSTNTAWAAWRASLVLLFCAAWLSGALFGLYIFGFFGGAALRGEAALWNESLPGLFDLARLAPTLAIAAHMAAGAVLMVLGPLQMIGPLRRARPGLHRALGRTYVACAAVAALGGLAFIAGPGTIGGLPMDLGFGLYGVLVLSCALQVVRNGRAGRTMLHQAWAIRLFALTIGSWLYRMEYGLWFALADGAGHTASFDGWFDRAMTVLFYLPNLAVAELIVRRRRDRGPPHPLAMIAVLASAGLVLFATWSFTTRYWGPGVVRGLQGGPPMASSPKASAVAVCCPEVIAAKPNGSHLGA